jgi:hypothetical protein
MIVTIASFAFAGAFACLVGTQHLAEHSPEARRLFGVFFCLCCGSNLVVATVAWASGDEIAYALAAFTAPLLVICALRLGRHAGRAT